MHWFCLLCEGRVESRRILGQRQHGRCTRCGMTCSRGCACHDVSQNECPIHGQAEDGEETQEMV